MKLRLYAFDKARTGINSENQLSHLRFAIIDLRKETELPLKPEGLQAADIPGIVEEAITEAGDLYPVPRYMSDTEITTIVRGLLPAA